MIELVTTVPSVVISIGNNIRAIVAILLHNLLVSRVVLCKQLGPSGAVKMTPLQQVVGLTVMRRRDIERVSAICLGMARKRYLT